MLHVNGNLNGVQLFLQPRTTIPVMVRSELTGGNPLISEMDRPGSGLHTMPVSLLVRRAGLEQSPYVAGIEPRPDGPPVINVPPGRYTVEIYSPGAGTYIQSARYGETDVLREELVVQPAAAPHPIEVVLRDDGGTLTFKVAAIEQNAVVSVLMLPEAAPNQARVFPVSSTAEVSVSGLAPGDYKILAFDSLEQVEFKNPEVLSQYSSRAAHVTVNARGKTRASLDVIHTGE